MLRQAKEHHFNAVRLWAFNDGSDQWNSLQPHASIFDEEMLRALDLVIDAASQYDVGVLPVFGNYWHH